MIPSEAKNLLRILAEAADGSDATDSSRARAFRDVIAKVYQRGWDDGYMAGQDDEYDAARAARKAAEAAAKEAAP